MQQVWIHLPQDNAPEWVVLADDGRVMEGPHAGWPAQRDNAEVVLLIRAEEVLLLSAPRVAKRSAQQRQALPFALEEQLVAPVEQLHFAISESAGDTGGLAVAVVDRSLLRKRLSQLAAQGLDADHAFAESQCLPVGEAVSRWADGDRVVMRQSESRALTLPMADRESMQPWLERGGWLVGDAPTLPSGWVALARRNATVTEIDLLQGEFQPLRRARAEHSGWRWAIGLAAAAVVVVLIGFWVELRALQQHVSARNADMADVLRSAVPGLSRVVDPVAQLRAVAAGAGRSSDGISWLGRVAPLLAGTQQLTLESAEYRGDMLELVVVAEDVEKLDFLREQISSIGGLQAELASALRGSKGVEGRLRVTGASP